MSPHRIERAFFSPFNDNQEIDQQLNNLAENMNAAEKEGFSLVSIQPLDGKATAIGEGIFGCRTGDPVTHVTRGIIVFMHKGPQPPEDK